MSAIYLDESVGWRRWTAVPAGLIRVRVMLRPVRGELSLAAIALLFATLCYAGRETARRLCATVSMLSFHVVAGPLLVAALLLDQASWTDPDLTGWIVLPGAGFSVDRAREWQSRRVPGAAGVHGACRWRDCGIRSPGRDARKAGLCRRAH